MRLFIAHCLFVMSTLSLYIFVVNRISLLCINHFKIFKVMVKGKKMFTWIVCVFFVLIFGGLIVQDLSAKTMSGIMLTGGWTEGHRSSSTAASISAFVNGDILSIQSTSQRSDIVVRISKDGIVLYEARVSASEAEYTMIDLGGLDADAYVLDLTNQWGDHLYGIFEKEGSNSL